MSRIWVVFAFVVGFGVAWDWQGARADARVMDLQRQAAVRQAEEAAASAAALRRERDRTDQITRAAGQREAALDTKLQETQRALKTATTGRPCLGGAALRVLDQSTGLRPPPGSALASVLDRGYAGAAADPSGEEAASDTDVAEWIATSGRYYERCRARIHDIREWQDGAGK